MSEPAAPSNRLKAQVAAATAARLVLNVGHRMVYPFLPAIARGLNISMHTASLLVSARSAVGLLGPLAGPYSDAVGRRRMMAAGLLALACGAALTAVLAHYPVVLVGFVLLGLAKVVFDPSILAYLGDRVPYRRRGRVVAITELAWGGSILLGAPAMGWIIARWGWRSSFAVLSALALAALGGLVLALPTGEGTGSGSMRPFWPTIRLALGKRAAAAVLGVTCLMMAGNELIFVVYGRWMEDSFGLSTSRLGLATIVIGAAEILGELGVGGLSDRLGKRRSVGIGLALTAAGYLSLLLLRGDLSVALLFVFVLFLCFEFTIVTTIALATEMAPAARGTMMSLNVGAASLGRALAAPVAPLLWTFGEQVKMGGTPLGWNGLAAGVTTLLALVLLLGLVPEPQQTIAAPGSLSHDSV